MNIEHLYPLEDVLSAWLSQLNIPLNQGSCKYIPISMKCKIITVITIERC